MNDAQKAVAVLALLIIVALGWSAPHEVRGTSALGSCSLTLYEPIWTDLSNQRAQKIIDDAGLRYMECPKVETVRLDAGRLGLWWVAIGATSALGIALLGKKRPA